MINVFDWSRRTVLVLHGLAALVALGYMVLEEPDLRSNFETAGPGRPFLNVESCDDAGAMQLVDRRTPKDRNVLVRLCFKPEAFPDGRMLVPYRASDGTVRGDVRYSEEVEVYTKRQASEFTLPPVVGREMDSQWWGQKVQIISYGLMGFLIWFVGVQIIVSVIGWAVRSLLRIPRGQDAWRVPPEGG